MVNYALVHVKTSIYTATYLVMLQVDGERVGLGCHLELQRPSPTHFLASTAQDYNFQDIPA